MSHVSAAAIVNKTEKHQQTDILYTPHFTMIVLFPNPGCILHNIADQMLITGMQILGEQSAVHNELQYRLSQTSAKSRPMPVAGTTACEMVCLSVKTNKADFKANAATRHVILGIGLCTYLYGSMLQQ